MVTKLAKVRFLLRPEWAALLLLGCSAQPATDSTGAAAAAGGHPAITLDAGLGGQLELVSVERLEPGQRNRLEILVTVKNTGSERVEAQSQLTWLSSSGGMRGGQTFDHSIAPGAEELITAPTNDRQVADFRLRIGPVVTPAVTPPPPKGLVLTAPSAGARAQGSLAVFARAEAASYRLSIDGGDCRDFRFTPGGLCELEAETPAGSTTTFLVEYTASSAAERRGSVQVEFDDPARAAVTVELRGRVGDGPRGSYRIDLD